MLCKGAKPAAVAVDHRGRRPDERLRFHPAAPQHSALSGPIDGGPAAIDAVEISPEQRGPPAPRADGNGVDAEAESAKLAENGRELSALVQVAGAQVQIMRSAMGVA